MCHKWNRGDCRYQNASKCVFGVHKDPRKRRRQDVPAEERPAQSRTVLPKARPKAGKAPSETATDALIEMLMMEPHSDENLRRLLLSFHPDKVKSTQFEPVFNKVTQKILALRERQ